MVSEQTCGLRDDFCFWQRGKMGSGSKFVAGSSGADHRLDSSVPNCKAEVHSRVFVLTSHKNVGVFKCRDQEERTVRSRAVRSVRPLPRALVTGVLTVGVAVCPVVRRQAVAV